MMHRVDDSGEFPISEILVRLTAGEPICGNQIKRLLTLTDKGEIEHLFAAARSMRRRYFGRRIFLYGFLYFSTHCRNDCCFCQYRRSNADLVRYRKGKTEILAAAREMACSGVHLIDLTMGEDPLFFSERAASGRICDIAAAVKIETGLPIMISPGVVAGDDLTSLAKAGIDWYACYQETHNIGHFKRLRRGQSYTRRLDAKRAAKKQGMLVEEGLLLGAGETLDDVADSLFVMQREEIDQVRAMSFIPMKGVTIDGAGPYTPLREYLTIAVMRLMMPDRLIPASLDVDGLQGLAARLNAGANVVTSVIPPDNGLSGVAHKSLDIEDARRSMEQIVPVIHSCGLAVATPQMYAQWIHRRRCAQTQGWPSRDIAKCA